MCSQVQNAKNCGEPQQLPHQLHPQLVRLSFHHVLNLQREGSLAAPSEAGDGVGVQLRARLGLHRAELGLHCVPGQIG